MVSVIQGAHGLCDFRKPCLCSYIKLLSNNMYKECNDGEVGNLVAVKDGSGSGLPSHVFG